MTASPPVPPPSDNWTGGPEVAELAYSSLGPGRPWLVGAIGVTSIVVASLSLLATLYSGLMLLPMLFFSATTIGPTGMATPTTPANTITQQDADTIVAVLDGMATIAPADQQTLAAALMTSEIPFAPPADGKWTSAHVSGQLTGYSSSNFGGSTFTTYSLNSGGDVTVNTGTISFSYWDANGNYVNSTYGAGGAGTTTNAFGTNSFGPDFSTSSIAMQIASFVLSLGLAVLLLIAGIQTVRGMPSGRKLHLWWAWPKLLVAAFAAAGWYFWFNGMFGGFGPGGPPVAVGLVMAATSFAVAIIWPITVLILLRAQSVRAYYADA